MGQISGSHKSAHSAFTGALTIEDLIPGDGGRVRESVFVTGCPGVGDVVVPDSVF